MLLRRLLGRCAAVPRRLRRSLATAVLPPSWAMINTDMPAVISAPLLALGACVFLAEPPGESFVFVPEHLLNASALPEPSSGLKQFLVGHVRSATADGLLLLRYLDIRATDLRVDEQTGQATGIDPNHVTRLVCNPVTGELFRLPDIDGASNFSHGRMTMGLLTQTDRGHGPPHRYAVVDFWEATRMNWVMQRFLSETGEWDTVVSAPYRLSRARVLVEQEALAFGGWLWWVDLAWGAISTDPFDDRPEPRFVELPRGSVLPECTAREQLAQELPWYRRMGVSEGRLRYAEVSQREPFVLSSFALDEEAGDWTLEHRVALSSVWADGGYPWLPLQGEETPRIGALDPLNANVTHVTVGEHVVAVDMEIGKVVGSSLYRGVARGFVPCVLPPWLGFSRIPSAGMKLLV